MGLNIPASYQAVIIDEGHDLISPLVEILDRSPQVVITLGINSKISKAATFLMPLRFVIAR